ncbi:Uncharacterised protein [Mycobacteroides abscessus subsp. abscessus]|nr:Uncharacterised protein [Mycobacteroides abscessus subsp. abscessus]
MELFANSKAFKQDGRFRFSFPAVQFSKFTFQLSCLHSIFIREISFHIDGVFFLHNLV